MCGCMWYYQAVHVRHANRIPLAALDGDSWVILDNKTDITQENSLFREI